MRLDGVMLGNLMKISRVAAFRLAAVFMCAGVLPLKAALPTAGDENVVLSVSQTEPVMFPNGVLLHGIYSGKVRLVVSVDAEGHLVDLLVVSYTNAAFVSPVVRAVKNWTYEPAKVRGRARASRVDLSFVFKSDLNVTVMNSDVNFIHELFAEQNEFQPSLLKDLDHIPTPIHVVSPSITDGELAPGEERVVSVEFYIDQEGKVRVPAVSRDQADDRLAAAAVAAVEQWRFEPPLRKKQPVLVLAQQDFHFVAKPKP